MENRVKRLTKNISRNALSVFSFFLFLYYIIPLFASYFLHEEYSELFKGMEYRGNFIYLPIIILLLLLFDNLLPKFKGIKSIVGKGIIKSIKVNYLLVFIFLVLSINFYISYSINFRHTTTSGMSGEGIKIILLFALKSYFKVYLLYCLIISSFELRRNELIIIFIIGVSNTLSINSSLEVLTIAVSVFLIIKKGKFYFTKPQSFNVLKFVKRRGVIILLGVGVVFMGNANKIGFDRTYEVFTNKDQIKQLVFHTSKRVSTYYVSLLKVPEVSIDENEFSINVLQGIVDNLFLRFNYLLGNKSGEKPLIWSVNRMNYLQIFKHTYNNPRTGAAPGFAASAFYLPWFPFNLFVISFYLVLILRKLSSVLIKLKKSPNIFFNLMVMFLCLNLFDTPVDLLNIISPGFIFLFFFYALPQAIENRIKTINS